MTWEIVAGIIVLVGFVASIGGMLWKLSAMISKLEAAVMSLADAVKALRGDNAAEPREMGAPLRDHEKRIGRLEGGKP